MYISYGELVLMAFGIGVLWVIFFWWMLNLLDKWGFINPDYEQSSDESE
jgi:hypothetical protein